MTKPFLLINFIKGRGISDSLKVVWVDNEALDRVSLNESLIGLEVDSRKVILILAWSLIEPSGNKAVICKIIVYLRRTVLFSLIQSWFDLREGVTIY